MRPQVEEKGSAFACVALLLTLFVDLSKTLSQPWRIPELRYLKEQHPTLRGPRNSGTETPGVLCDPTLSVNMIRHEPRSCQSPRIGRAAFSRHCFMSSRWLNTRSSIREAG